MIVSGAGEVEIRETAIKEGMSTLGEDAVEKVRTGITTIEEIRRVVYLEGEAAFTCSSCGKAISVDFPVCPYCGHSAENICPNCRRHRAADWIVCPYCRTGLS